MAYNLDFFDEPDMLAHATQQSLEIKIEKAIGLYRMYYNLKGTLCIANSGGKDSDCLMTIAKLAGVPFVSFYSNVTIDPPELVYHLKRNCPDTKWISQPVPLLKKLLDKSCGPPTRNSRWCCELYKEQSLPNLPIKIIGVRAQESVGRKKRWREIVPDRNNKLNLIMCPILYWTEDDVWNFHKQENIKYCCLYDDPAFKRLGCVGCPLASSCHRKYEFQKWPRYEANWKRSVMESWKKWVNVPLDKPRWIKDYNGKDQRIKPEAGDICETKQGVKGFWTRQRWFREYESEESFWCWWLNDETPVSDECQYARLLV